MRKYEFSPAIAAAMRSRALAASVEMGVPLHLEAPRYDAFNLPPYVEYDAEDARIEAAGYTIGDDEDDDFY